MLQNWQPNTLPLPMLAELVTTPEVLKPEAAKPELVIQPVMVDVDDNFPKGRVVKFFPYQRYGFILDRNGREVYFNLSEVDFVGAKGSESLAVGVPVGYDVSWTSNGLHVKKIKLY